MCIAAVVVTVAFGCKKQPDTTGAGSGSGSAADAKPHRAGNCPSTVARSTTAAAVDGSNVDVTITSDDQDAIAAVQKRTDELLAGRVEHHDTGTEHKQNGEHGGAMGMCPVYIPEGATATAKHLPNGVMVAIAGKDTTALKTEIDGRIQRASDWAKANIPTGDKGTQGGLGGGKNDEGMNHSGKGDGKGIERKHAQGSDVGSGSAGSSAMPR